MQIKNNFLSSKKGKFLLLLPLFILPFFTLIFWLMGGGSNQNLFAEEHQAKKLLSALPEVDLSAQKGFDKMSYYQEAESDAEDEKKMQVNDPYYQAPDSELDSYSANGQNSSLHAGNVSGNQEAQLYQKLQRLNQIMESSDKQPMPATPSTKVENPKKSKEIVELENMMKAMENGKAEDPEMLQLNAMLQKIMVIQHPELLAQNENPVPLGSIYSAIPAVIEGNQKVSYGSVIKLRLLEAVSLNGQSIPKGHLIFGICELSNQRLKLRIKNIRLDNQILPVDLTVYDKVDGMEGINAPDAIFKDAIRNGSDQAVQGLQVLPFDQSMEMQIAGAGISAAKGFFNKKVKRVKVKLEDGYPILLKNN